MADIIRITIKGGSGYRPVDETCSDKVTVDLDSIKSVNTAARKMVFSSKTV